MPIYEYACKNCEHTLEALQKVADAPLVDCPACGKPALKRLLSAPRFRLKGQGWYETDFKKENQRNIAGEKEPASTVDSPSADKSGDKSGDKGTDKAVTKSKDAADGKPKPSTDTKTTTG